ncbi:MAG: two-component system, LuxR family, response regulator FixJ [Sphingomonadales bacterium]|nr:two-component system, LuxR family, response regulator FixJ [Sphingomonadales bacterium]
MSVRRMVAVVDDDEVVRLSITYLLGGAGHHVLSFASGDDFLAARLPEHLDCVLLDLNMPGRSGIEVLDALAGRGEAPAVVVITGQGNVALAVEAIKRGAIDFLEKPYAPTALLAAVDAGCVLRDQPRAFEIARREAEARLDVLSPRQRQVLAGIVGGRPNKIIAYQLGLSIRTVEAYRAQLLQKLGARGTAEVVRIGLAGGLGMPKMQS